MMEQLPNAPACERNREPILRAMLPYLGGDSERSRRILEIGSGTGQHAAFFCDYFASDSADASLRGLQWQCSDIAANLDGIEAWRKHAACPNFLPALELDLAKRNWPAGQYDFIYTANTLHIVSWKLFESMCECVAHCLVDGGRFFVYGPFNYGGAYTSESNAAFDASLRGRDPDSGIRDFEAVCATLAEAAYLAGAAIRLQQDIEMPANNRLLVFDKS